MPLTTPVERDVMHTRNIKSNGFKRIDGLWDIEVHLTDVKSYEVANSWRGTLRPGIPIHDMWIRLTINDDLVIQDIEVCSDSTPYQMCPNVAPNFKNLIGIQIGVGWSRKIKSHVGGVKGCTHLVELMNVLATVAFQTVFSIREKELMASGEKKPPMLNNCFAWDTKSPVVKDQYPAWYEGD